MNNSKTIGVIPNLLSRFEIFQNLDSESLFSVAQHFQLRDFSANQYIISLSQKKSDVFFIVGGNVRVCAFSEDGRQVQFEDLQEGMMFGEMAAIDGQARSSDCIATEPTTVAHIRAEKFLEVIANHPGVAFQVMQRLVSMIRMQMARVFEFSTSTVNKRIRFELLRMASANAGEEIDVVIPDAPTHADIAARISTHREAVTRELKSLESKGIITWSRNEHVIHDVAALTNLSA